MPTPIEQAQIADYIEGATYAINPTIDRARREISLLHEYRTRLIADVVIGKLDVREVAAQLPDETGEPEPPNETDALTDPGEEDAAEELVH